MAIAVCAAASVGISAFAADAPLWDLANNEIPTELRSGTIEKADGVVSLRDGAAFAVPAEAFPDQANFTVQVTLSLGELVQDAVFTAMRKQSGEDVGFSFSFNYRETPYHARKVNSVVNGILMTGGSLNGREAPQLDTPHTPHPTPSPWRSARDSPHSTSTTSPARRASWR